MKKFQYKVAIPPSYPGVYLEGWLDELGSQGWELIHINENNVFYFKREVI